MASTLSNNFNVTINRNASPPTNPNKVIESNNFNVTINRPIAHSTEPNTVIEITKAGVALTPVNGTPTTGQYKVTITNTVNCKARLESDYKTITVTSATGNKGQIDIRVNIENKRVYTKSITVANMLQTTEVNRKMSEVKQTADALTAKFTDGFDMGITQVTKDGIKVYHNQIDGENYTHMSPAGFYVKYKGENIFMCDQNGLTYKGTITGSTINGSIFKSGAEYNPYKQNITGLQMQDDTIYSYGTKNNGMYAVTKIAGGTINIGNGADGAGLNWSTHVTSSDISMFKQGGTGYFYVGTTNAPGSGYSTTTTTIDTNTINIGSRDETTALKVGYNNQCEFGNNYFTKGTLTINQLSQGSVGGAQTYLSGTTISATTIYQNGSKVTGSDIILKDNIKEYEGNALDIVNKTNIYSFNRISDPSRTEIGFIAQQVPDELIYQHGKFTAEELEGLTPEEKTALLEQAQIEANKERDIAVYNKIAEEVTPFYDLDDEQTQNQIDKIQEGVNDIEYTSPVSMLHENNIIGIMWKAIQELSKKVDELSK